MLSWDSHSIGYFVYFFFTMVNIHLCALVNRIFLKNMFRLYLTSTFYRLIAMVSGILVFIFVMTLYYWMDGFGWKRLWLDFGLNWTGPEL